MVIDDDFEILFEFDPDQINFESENLQIIVDECMSSTNQKLKSRSISSEESDEDARSKRFRPSSESDSEDGVMNSNVNKSSVIGLSLKKTPSFVSLLESQLSEGKTTDSSSTPRLSEGNKMASSSAPRCSEGKKIATSSPPRRRVGRPSTKNANGNKSKLDDFASASEKLKASNFPALKLTVGTWERNSKHEGDLIAKCYYAKKKLVWEVLDGPLKCKIEIQWSDIIAIRAITPPGDHPGVLEIELNQPPLYYRETNPQPRKHTLWQLTSDFTGGQAPIHRRHCVRFAPGVLDRHYDKLLRYDSRLNGLSKQPFPSQLCPYFDQTDSTREFSGVSIGNIGFGSQYLSKMNSPFHYLASSPSLGLLTNNPMHNKSPMMPVPIRQVSSGFPVSGVDSSNYGHMNQNSVHWGQGPNNNMVNVAMENQTIGMLPGPTAQATNWNIVPEAHQNHQPMYLQNDSNIMGNNQERLMLNYIKNHLFDDNINQVAYPSINHKPVVNVDSMYPLLEFNENVSLDPTTTLDVHGLNFGYHQTMDNYGQDNIVVPNNVMTLPEPITWTGQNMEDSANPYPALDHANQDIYMK